MIYDNSNKNYHYFAAFTEQTETNLKTVKGANEKITILCMACLNGRSAMSRPDHRQFCSLKTAVHQQKFTALCFTSEYRASFIEITYKEQSSKYKQIKISHLLYF